MIDWTKSMIQTFEFYEVDPLTWGEKKRINTIKSASVKFDIESDLLSTASIELTEKIGEIYVRIYLIAIQEEKEYRFCLGTYLTQSPKYSFDGSINEYSIDAYSPLVEIREKYVPIGTFIPSGSHILESISSMCYDISRSPVIISSTDKIMESNYLSNIDDNYLTFCRDALRVANYRFDLDDIGRILFSPIPDSKSLKPIWEYNDDNSSILYPDISLDKDLYGIPNVVEVIYSKQNGYLYSRAENNEDGNPLSIKNRGRELIYRDTNPSFSGDVTDTEVTQSMLDDYANSLLSELSNLECTVSYKHGYCPVRIGDCIRLNYKKSGLNDILAIVKSQSINCEPGCEVEETATFSSSMWDG